MSAVAVAASSSSVRARRTSPMESAEGPRRRGRELLKGAAPAAQAAYLESSEGRAALGARECRRLLRRLQFARDQVLLHTASAAVLDAWWRDGTLPPGFELHAEYGLVHTVRDPERCRVGAVRMVMGNAGVRAGREHPPGTDPREDPISFSPTQRWTPPQAVECEDFFDGMGVMEAMRYSGPPSCSAVVIQRIGELRARPEDGLW